MRCLELESSAQQWGSFEKYHRRALEERRWENIGEKMDGCCKQCCNEHWDTCILLNYDFLRVYAQWGDCRVCHTEWSNSEKEKQISYINAYMWNLEKWSWWTYFQGRSRDPDIENRYVDPGEGEEEGGTKWEKLTKCQNWHIHYLCIYTLYTYSVCCC